MAEVVEAYKPNSSTYDAIEVECAYEAHERPDQLDRVRVRWYDDGALTIVVRGGAPALMSRCYLEGEGRDVILRLEPVSGA